ncbi:MAG TPA: hypothetical protein VJR06_04460 [Nitrososphaerales archaeon]|nr:hypothetical protein [Nitrososphaerales archaeon]
MLKRGRAALPTTLVVLFAALVVLSTSGPVAGGANSTQLSTTSLNSTSTLLTSATTIREASSQSVAPGLVILYYSIPELVVVGFFVFGIYLILIRGGNHKTRRR